MRIAIFTGVVTFLHNTFKLETIEYQDLTADMYTYCSDA